MGEPRTRGRAVEGGGGAYARQGAPGRKLQVIENKGSNCYSLCLAIQLQGREENSRDCFYCVASRLLSIVCNRCIYPVCPIVNEGLIGV
jgi:hypothetical protein